ncbi:MAG: ABC transporter ATP-binding protein [Alistipes sp.]|nr:ABC transporter ATP-binding protein [Alistipes sp.]
MNYIEVKEIKKSYGRKEILKGASFFAKKGECVALVGANGCGKSTLLGVLAGTLKAASGEILYDGENPLQNRKIFQKYVGYVPQENPLMDKLSVYDNLRFWYCDTKRSIDEDMDNGILKEFGLDVYRKYPVAKLSGGLKKRLSIACALAADPQILIMDEPGAALDVVCKEEIKRYLIRYRQEGGTVLLTSHEEAELSLCDRMYLLKDGTLSELADKPVGAALLERLK